MNDKIFYRCTVCQDIHYGVNPPEICPTCTQKNVYIQVDKEEANLVMKNE